MAHPMKSIAAAASLLACLSGTSLLVAADKPLVAAAGDGSGRIATAFATESGGEELEAFALQAGAVILGLLLLILAYRTARKGPARLRAVLLVLVGVGLMAGGILYGQ